MTAPTQRGTTVAAVIAAFHRASQRSYPVLVEARDRVGFQYRWDTDGATLARVEGMCLRPLTDDEHAGFELALAAGRIIIVERQPDGAERVLHEGPVRCSA